MKTVYDVIDDLRQARGLSGRALAQLAGIQPTTYTSFMARRPPSIPKRHLEALGNVFGMEWHEFLNLSEDARVEKASESKVSVAISDEDYEMFRIANLAIDREPSFGVGVTGRGIAPEERARSKEYDALCREQYRRSVFFMTEKLNSKGIMNVMQRIIELTNDPQYCIEEQNKEDTEWQKEKLPMAAEPSD